MTLRHTFSGAAMLSVVRLLRLLAQFVTIPILSRLLDPHEYGLMAIAMPFALFAMMIADAGIGMSLVRTPQSNRHVWSTGFWLTVLLGLILAGFMAASAPLAAYIFSEPALTPMLLTLALIVLAQAVHLIPVSALQQAQRFRTIAAIDVAGTLLSLTTAIFMAYHGYGVWALVAQQLSYFAVRVVFTCALSPFRPIRAFAWDETREHLQFGRDVLASNLMAYCSRQMDNWIVGKALATAALGFYAMAFQFARLPAQLVSGPLNYAMYSVMANIKDDLAAQQHTLAITTRLVALLVIPAMGMVAVAHAPIFSLLLSSKWQMAGTLFMILAPAAALQAVGTATETTLYAIGRSDIHLRRMSEYSILWPVTLLLTVSHGLTAAAIAYSTCTLLYHLRYCQLALKPIGFRLQDYAMLHLPAFFVTALAIAAYLLLSANAGDIGKVILSASLALLAIAFGLILERRTLMEAMRTRNASPQQAT